MKQLKELWTLVNNWLGNGKKCIIGLAFLLVGFVMNWFSHPVEGLSQIPFTLMIAGGLCLVNALFSKWTDKNINLLFFVLAFICVMDLGIVLLDGDFSQFTTMVTVTCACTVFSWALNFALLQSVEVDGAAKKIVMSFLATVCSAVIMAAVFVGSIWLAS